MYNTVNDDNPRYSNDDAENIDFQQATTNHQNQSWGKNGATSVNGNIYYQL